MLSRGPRPLNISSQVSPHPSRDEVARVFNAITKILEIIRRDHDDSERRNSYLPTATLDRIFDLSESLWEEVMSLPLSTVLALHKHLIIYGLILVDIQHILSSSDPVEIDSLAIDFRLDDFLLQFQEALDLLKVPTDQLNTPNSTHFFQNSRGINIYGGNFTGRSTINPVVHDPVVQEQSRKILRALYIQCVVLFF